MLLIQNQNVNPFFNLALEEYLFKHKEESCIMLWRNSKSVIIGKHQNTLREVNLPFVEENNIPIIRRLSGGGTVYHDEGNLNFTLILTRDTDLVVDFKRYMQPIYEAIKTLIPEIQYSPRNDLFVHGKKFSGNAEHAVKRRVLHHGTLLFNANLDNLESAIQPVGLKILGNAVASVRSKVINLEELITPPMSIQQFKSYLDEKILGYFDGIENYELTKLDIDKVEELAEEKYKTWEWNFGYSPKYSIEIDILHIKQQIRVKVLVRKGLIESIVGDDHLGSIIKELNQLLVGVKHKKESITLALEKVNSDIVSKDLLKLLIQQII